MKYICHNPKCDKYEIPDDYSSETYVFRNGHLVGEHCNCPICGQLREEIDPNKDIPLSQKNIEIGTYSSMSPEQRREALKKRSHEHFLKNVKERKDGLINAAMKEMSDYKKGKL